MLWYDICSTMCVGFLAGFLNGLFGFHSRNSKLIRRKIEDVLEKTSSELGRKSKFVQTWNSLGD